MSENKDHMALDALDPGSRDPGFWLRFHGRVMASAQAELARRRMVGDVGVVDLVFAWRKALVPMALLAAALAGILLIQSEVEAPVQTVALEELLTEDLNLLTASGVLIGDGLVRDAVFAGVEGGF
jgi:hypothetical protein